MCGRMSQDDDLDAVYRELVGEPFPGEANFNTAPTETVWIVRRRRRDDEAGAGLEAAAAQWWLTPYWSKTPKPRYATFNARAETLRESRTFGEPFRRRRCLVPVTGFYEWRRAGAVRQPFFVCAAEGPLLLAGVWDRWRSRDRREVVESCAVVTTASSPALAFLHDRQPLMLGRSDVPRWLQSSADPAPLDSLLTPRLPVPLTATPVSDYVGDPRHKAPRCLAATGAGIEIAADAGATPP